MTIKYKCLLLDREIEKSKCDLNKGGKHVPRACRECELAQRAPKKETTNGSEKPQAPKGEKWCSNCEDFHPVEAFGKNSISSDGLLARCKISLKRESLRAGQTKGTRVAFDQETRERLIAVSEDLQISIQEIVILIVAKVLAAAERRS